MIVTKPLIHQGAMKGLSLEAIMAYKEKFENYQLTLTVSKLYTLGHFYVYLSTCSLRLIHRAA